MLSIGPRFVEWLDMLPAGSRYGCVPIEKEGSEELLSASERAWQEAGRGRKACILVLQRGLAAHRLLSLPSIPRRELLDVFRRKAEQLIGAEHGDVLFTTRNLGTDPAEGTAGASSTNWLLVALRGEIVRPLRERLRARGFRVVRVVSGSLSTLAHARTQASAPEKAVVVVSIEPSSVGLALVEGERLHNCETIEGDLRTSPSMATGLLAEVRSRASFWKRKSRGEALGQVVIVGMASDRGELFARAVRSALPEAEVALLPAGGDDAAVRQALLASVHATGRLNPDLTFQLSPKRGLVALLATATCLCGVSVALRTFDHFSSRLEGVRSETRAFTRALGEMDGIVGEHERAQALVGELARRTERMAEIETYGVPLEALLEGIPPALSGRAVLQELAVSADPQGGGSVRLRAETLAEPLRALHDLRALARDMEELPTLETVDLELPERIGSQESGRFSFTVEAELEI